MPQPTVIDLRYSEPQSKYTQALVKNIRETQLEDIPREIVERAKEEIIDIVGCMLGGANDTGNPMILNLVKTMGGNPEATIISHGVKTSSPNAALVNAIMARSFDFGAVETWVEGQKTESVSTKQSDVIAAHLGEPMIPAGLAVAEQYHISGRELLTALIVGEDMVARMKAAAGHRLPTAYNIGATAVAGRLLGLNEKQMFDAFGIAVHQSAGIGESMADSTHCFKLNLGLAAQQGVFSARLAKEGWTGMKEPITGGYGAYYYVFNPEYDPEALIKDIGEKYWTTITFKPFPSCRATHSSVENALNIYNESHVKPEDIDEVIVVHHTKNVPAVCMQYPANPEGVTHVNAIFSIQYCVANVLLRGYPKPQHFTEEAILDPAVQDIVKKVKLYHDDYPGKSFLSCAITLKTKDGREYHSFVEEPLGNELVHPLSREAKFDKYRNNAEFNGKVSMAHAEEALSMMEKIEDVKDVSDIVNLLVE